MKLLRTHGTLIIDHNANTKVELVEYCVKNNISLCRADLREVDLHGADLREADLYGADFREADLREANLYRADLREADLTRAYLYRANLTRAGLKGADLEGADLEGADLTNTKGLVKIMGVTQGNFYWKRFNSGLNNNNYQFKVGLNTLTPGEVFADDDRVLCSYPGFHFASKSWCDVNYGDRPLEAKIRIPEDAKINEPWATDGKASANMIEIIQVFDVATGEDVTDQYR